MSDATRITFAELADRLGVEGSGATAGRHRAARSSNAVGRLVAGTVAGAALTGGAAL
ncbi:M23 family peptidase, partial [Dietzia sp. E1]|nr:M23 family peptidase [Dietzia sp. E1]